MAFEFHPIHSSGIPEALLDYARRKTLDQEGGAVQTVEAKLALVGAVLSGTAIAGGSALKGIWRALASRNEEKTQDAWDRMDSALDAVFHSFTGLIDSSSVLSVEDRKNLQEVQQLVQEVAQVENQFPTLSQEVKRELDGAVTLATHYVKHGDSSSAATAIQRIHQAIRPAIQNPEAATLAELKDRRIKE